ncbi:hypothetical protein V8C44DRAFT_341163 [Trichoderma aethiopicum]
MHLDARLPRQSDVLSASKAVPGQRPENQLKCRWGRGRCMCAGACTPYLLGAEPCNAAGFPLPLTTSAVEVCTCTSTCRMEVIIMGGVVT